MISFIKKLSTVQILFVPTLIFLMTVGIGFNKLYKYAYEEWYLRPLVEKVQTDVSSVMKYITDEDLTGGNLTDVWRYDMVQGDCEDHAIAKLYNLRGLGVPEYLLSLVICYSEKDKDYHALAKVGSFYLDNRKNNLKVSRKMINCKSKLPSFMARSVYTMAMVDDKVKKDAIKWQEARKEFYWQSTVFLKQTVESVEKNHVLPSSNNFYKKAL